MELISGYMRDEQLRHALNELTAKTFGFDFEGWVTGGYFEGDYIPYSFIENGKILANVSANIMKFDQNGRQKNYIQLGTVMTDEPHRRQGLAGSLIMHVIEKYKDSDGIYLFGNLDSLGFYRKTGFKEGLEYSCSVKKEFLPKGNKSGFVPVSPEDSAMKERYMDAVRNSAVNSSLEQMNKFGLQMFYTSGLDGVSYAEDLDCFIVSEKDGDTLLLNSVISKNTLSLKDVLDRLEGGMAEIKPGFTPLAQDLEMCELTEYDGADDYRLFYIGDEIKSIEEERLYFPEFSHA